MAAKDERVGTLTDTDSRSGLIGRERELAALLEHVNQRGEPGGFVDLITGEPGIGKSPLVGEYTRRTSDAGGAVHTGRCIEELVAAARIGDTDVSGTHRRVIHPGGLTGREVEILHEISTGKTVAEIAEALFISTKTVSNHVGNIFRKTDSANRTEAARFAARRGLGPS